MPTGDGSGVPDWIIALYSGDAGRADEAMSQLFNSVLHQGSVYPAAVAAVPFLAHAAVHAVHGRADALAMLAGAGGQCTEPRPGDEEEGHTQVGAEVPGLLHLLGDSDAEVRRYAVRVARRADSESVPAAVQALTAAYASDPVAAVRAEALTVVTRIDPDPQACAGRLHDALADPAAAVRAVAALALLERTDTPYPADLVVLSTEVGDGSHVDAILNG